MAKESGLGHFLFVDGFDLSGDIGSVSSIATHRAALDVTGIDKSGHERISGLIDADIAFDSWFNPSASQSHPVLGTMLGTAYFGDRMVQYFAGTVVGNNCFNLMAKQVDYAPKRGADGSLAASISAVGSQGVIGYWGDMLTTGKQTFASAGSAVTTLDYTAASTAFGAVGYLQVFSLASGTVTVAIQDSADNASFANITGLAFTAATGRTTERLATGTTATIRRYLRVNMTGTFTNAVIAVGVIKFDVAQS